MWLELFTRDDDGEEAPPGTGPDQLKRMQGGPWFQSFSLLFQTQLVLSLSIGLISFVTFLIFRTRWKVMYAPRTLLKGFAPHEVHDKETLFGWIVPTLRASEFTILQLVGLDAVVLLNFFKMGFYFFLFASVVGCTVLMPINWRQNGTLDGIGAPDVERNGTMHSLILPPMAEGSTIYLSSHLIATYAFSIVALVLLHRTYARFVHTRQLFALDHAHSAPARTVMVSKLPPHLRNDRALAQYWEDMGDHMLVESVSMGRQVGDLATLLADRTKKLRALEVAWTAYVGNPCAYGPPHYRRDAEVAKILGKETTPSSTDESEHDKAPLIDHDHPTDAQYESMNGSSADHGQLEINKGAFVIGGRNRPTKRLGWAMRKVDLLDYLASEFRDADEAVRSARRGRFHPTHLAFVTFETLAAAQVASQVVHYPQPDALVTVLAPEPRDVHWANLALGEVSITVRTAIASLAMILLLLFYLIPLSQLARLLSFRTVKKSLPWLSNLIDKSPRLRALVQNSLPVVATISFNALIPMFLEVLCVFQGLRARSWIEYSILKKYFAFLVINVIVIFITVSTWSLVKDLTNQPMRLIEKLATSLPTARIFFVSYTMFQGIGIMPLQLVQLAVILPRLFFRVFLTRTPRDFAELNAPPTLNLGVVYPQAILIYVIGLTYSVISPLVLPFAAIYFGLGYMIYKYKLLFVYYRTYESRGQAWPISFTRLAFGLVLFQVFMGSLLFLHTAFALAVAVAPLLLVTFWSCYRMHNSFLGLSSAINLSQAAEVQRSTSQGPGDIERLHKGYPVTRMQTKLNRARYGASDDLQTAYVVAKDRRTDYAQPPMSDAFPGVLNTGRRRYAQPAIFGLLPAPWLPKPSEPEHTLGAATEVSKFEALELDLRQRWRTVKRVTQHAFTARSEDDATRAWSNGPDTHIPGPTGLDNGNAVTERAYESDEENDSEDEREEEDMTGMSPYRPFVPHPERRRSTHFPPRRASSEDR